MRPPKILPWLASRAGLPLREAERVWHETVADLDARYGGEWRNPRYRTELSQRLRERINAASKGSETEQAPQPFRLPYLLSWQFAALTTAWSFWHALMGIRTRCSKSICCAR
jgi:hypothetical protein